MPNRISLPLSIWLIHFEVKGCWVVIYTIVFKYILNANSREPHFSASDLSGSERVFRSDKTDARLIHVCVNLARSWDFGVCFIAYGYSHRLNSAILCVYTLCVRVAMPLTSLRFKLSLLAYNLSHELALVCLEFQLWNVSPRKVICVVQVTRSTLNFYPLPCTFSPNSGVGRE